MNKYFSRRVRGFFTAQLPGHILILLFLWIITNIEVWTIFFAAYLALIALGFIYELFLVWRYTRERVYAKEVRKLLFLLRNLIELAFIHDENSAKFHQKFLETVSAESLSSRGIVNPDALLWTPKYNRMCKQIRQEDAELWTLIMAGFSSRELKIIYGLKNINSVYIKRHRLRNRLDKRMCELIENREL